MAVYWSVEDKNNILLAFRSKTIDNDILVPLKEKDGIFTLQDIALHPDNWEAYFNQYRTSEDAPYWLNQQDFFNQLGIESTTSTALEEAMASAIGFFRGTGAGTLFDENNKIRREYFKLNSDGTLETSFPPPGLNEPFWIKSLRFDYHWSSKSGHDEATTKDAYFTEMESKLKTKAYGIAQHTFISYLFANKLEVVEALKARSTEFLKESGAAGAVFGWSDKKEIEWLKEAQKEGATAEQKEALKKIKAKKAGLASSEIDDAGFGTKRLWSEQCLLNSKFDNLAKFHKGEFLNTYTANPSHLFPKKDKTYFIESSQPSALINQLTSVPGSQTFLNMKNDKYSNLLPQIQLYSINYSRNNDKEKTVNREKAPILEPIKFPQNIKLFESQSITGRGDYGIKSFSWDLIASNPRTQRNDIQAELSIYFQSLDQIFGENVGNNLLKLLKRPPSRIREETKDSIEDKKENKSCGNTEISNSSGGKPPEYYELKADIGWRKANNSTALNQAEKDSINNQRLSLYLTLIDHTFNFSQDGTFTLTLTYRGRVEELLSKQTADALATPKFKMERQIIKVIKNYAALGSKKSDKSKEKLESFNELVQDHNVDFKRNAFSNIIDDMSTKNQIFYSRISAPEFADFINKGEDIPFNPNKNFFTMSDIENNNSPASSTLHGASAGFKTMLEESSTIEESGENGEDRPPSESFKLGDDQYFFSFFFLGDLLDTIFERACKFEPMQSVIDEYLGTESSAGKATSLLTPDLIEKAIDEVTRKLQQNNMFYQQMENTKLLLGSLPLSKAVEGTSSCETTNYNISQIPISTKLFKDWFAYKVVDRDIDVYPFTQFARDLIKELALYSLQSDCGKIQKTNIIFKSTSLTGRKPIDKAANFIISDQTPDLRGTHSNNYVIVDSQGPINFNQSQSEEEKAHSVIIIYTEDSSIKNLTGNYDEDLKSGIHHLNYGRDRGIVKQIQFSKNDIPGLREAKFSRDSLNPLSELSTIYNASITTVGNVIFWPGQKVFVNPLGMGSSIGHPSDKGSISGVLGLGGYYTLADVRSTIDASSFTTTIRAIWETSGQQGRLSIKQLSTNVNPTANSDITNLEEEEDK